MYHHLVLQWWYTGHRATNETEQQYLTATSIVLGSLTQSERKVIDFVYAKPDYPIGRLCQLCDMRPDMSLNWTKPLLTSVWERIEEEYRRVSEHT